MFFLMYTIVVTSWQEAGVSSSYHRLLTVEYVYSDRFRLSITGVTCVPSRVRRLRFLYQEETRRAVTLLRNHGDAASARVVADYLEQRSGDRS